MEDSWPAELPKGGGQANSGSCRSDDASSVPCARSARLRLLSLQGCRFRAWWRQESTAAMVLTSRGATHHMGALARPKRPMSCPDQGRYMESRTPAKMTGLRKPLDGD